ncbi:MAG: deoxyribonuclease IV [Candidatus Shapirobacteria bacterium]
MLIGAHVSIAGDLLNALRQAQKFNLNCLQIFSSPPRNWQGPHYSPKILTNFRQLAKKFRIKPIFVHAKYLINLSSEDLLIQKKSIASLSEDLLFAHAIGSAGVIFHPHAQNQINLVQNILRILNQSSAGTFLILENSAQIHLDVIGSIIQKVNHPRLKFCLDTAHLFEAGYDLNNPAVRKNVLVEIDQQIGLANWLVIHANNSQTKIDSHHDHHANLKEGLLKPDVFTFFLNHPFSQRLPFILETPDNLNDTSILPQLKTPSQ